MAIQAGGGNILCSSMNHHAIVPDCDIILAPLVTDLKIMVLVYQLIDYNDIRKIGAQFQGGLTICAENLVFSICDTVDLACLKIQKETLPSISCQPISQALEDKELTP